MSADLGELTAKLKVDTSALGDAKLAIDNFGKFTAAAFLGIGAAVVAVGGFAVDLAAKYNKSLDQIQADMGITRTAAVAIGAAFLGTAGQVTFSAEEIATAFAPVSAQLDLVSGHTLSAKEALTFMTSAMQLAEATGQPLNDVTAALARTMAAYATSGVSAATASDILFKASGDLNQPISSVADAVDKLHGKLGEATPPLATVAALMVDLSLNGVQARLAVSGAATAITTLIDPSKSAAAEIAKLHLKTLDVHGAFIGMDSIIAQLEPKFSKLTPAMQLTTAAMIFGKPAALAMVDIINKGPAAFDALTGSVDKTGSAQKGATTATDNLGDAWKRFTSGIRDMLTKAGTPMEKFLTGLVDAVTTNVLPALSRFADWMNTTGIPALQKFGGWIKEHILPSLQQFGGWIQTTGIPALQKFGGWITGTVVPALQTFGGWIHDHVLPVLTTLGTDVLNLGKWLLNNLVPPLISLAQTFLPPVVAIVGFFSDNIWLVYGALGAFLVQWGLVKLIGLVTTIASFAGAFLDFAGEKGVASATSAVLGFGGKGGAIEKILPGIGAMTTALGLTGGAAVTMGTDTTVATAQMELDMGGADLALAGSSAGIVASMGAIAVALAPVVLAMGLIAGSVWAVNYLINNKPSLAVLAQASRTTGTPGTTLVPVNGHPAILGVGHAAGGPVLAGVSYPVGEKGPEMFTPNQNGAITPNNRLGHTFNVHVTQTNPSPADISHALAWRMAHA